MQYAVAQVSFNLNSLMNTRFNIYKCVCLQRFDAPVCLCSTLIVNPENYLSLWHHIIDVRIVHSLMYKFTHLTHVECN